MLPYRNRCKVRKHRQTVSLLKGMIDLLAICMYKSLDSCIQHFPSKLHIAVDSGIVSGYSLVLYPAGHRACLVWCSVMLLYTHTR